MHSCVHHAHADPTRTSTTGATTRSCGPCAFPFQTLTTRKHKSFIVDFNRFIIHVQVFLPFQTLTTRKRKDVAVKDIKVQVVLMAFDCLYLNGEVMLRKPLVERRAALYASIKPEEGKVQFAVAKTSRDVEELQARPSPFAYRSIRTTLVTPEIL